MSAIDVLKQGFALHADSDAIHAALDQAFELGAAAVNVEAAAAFGEAVRGEYVPREQRSLAWMASELKTRAIRELGPHSGAIVMVGRMREDRESLDHFTCWEGDPLLTSQVLGHGVKTYLTCGAADLPKADAVANSESA